MTSTRLPGLGRTVGFSTSFWKIQGWEDRHALRRRTTGSAEASMSREVMGRDLTRALVPGSLRRHHGSMHLPTDVLPDDPLAQRARDRLRVKRAALASLAAVLLLC